VRVRAFEGEKRGCGAKSEVKEPGRSAAVKEKDLRYPNYRAMPRHFHPSMALIFSFFAA